MISEELEELQLFLDFKSNDEFYKSECKICHGICCEHDEDMLYNEDLDYGDCPEIGLQPYEIKCFVVKHDQRRKVCPSDIDHRLTFCCISFEISKGFDVIVQV